MKSKKPLIIAVTAVISLVVLLVISGFVYNSTRHTLIYDGPSMEPTIQNGQRIHWKAYTKGQLPEANDLIFFSQSNLKQYGQSRDTIPLIKRVVGAPGDQVVIKDGTLTIISTSHPQGYNPDAYFKNIATHESINITLAQNQYYVIGDNPNDSLDSRIFGPVNLDTIQGYVIGN